MNTPMNTQINHSLYSRFKPLVATFVSTLVIAACTAAPVPSNAATMNHSDYAKMCYGVTDVLLTMLRGNTDKQAIAIYDSTISTSLESMPDQYGFHKSLETLFYVGLSKRVIYKGDNLKQLMLLKCPDIFMSND